MNSLMKNYWLFYSLFCCSILLAAPKAITEEIKILSNSQTISEKVILHDLTKQNNSDISKFARAEEFSGVVTPSQKQPTFIVPTVATDESLVNLNPPSLQIAQVPPSETNNPNVNEAPTESPSSTEPQSSESEVSKQWHFLFQPYIYFPVSIYGNTTVKGFNADFAADASSIFSSLKDTFDFGLTGHLEGWSPNYHWGFILNGDYLKLSKENSLTRPNPDRYLDLAVDRMADRIQERVDDRLREQIADYIQGRLDDRIREQIEDRINAKLEDIIPSEFSSNLEVQTWNVNLAAAYRFYDQSQVNPKGVATEFDLGSFLFDIIGGVRIVGISENLDVDTNLGREGNFNSSITTAQPMLGARLRLNFSDNLAGVFLGTVAGFNIGSLGLSWQATAGLDWMFSGNTSVGIGYRFAYFEYEMGSGRDKFSVNLNNNGPYLNLTFRF